MLLLHIVVEQRGEENCILQTLVQQFDLIFQIPSIMSSTKTMFLNAKQVEIGYINSHFFLYSRLEET